MKITSQLFEAFLKCATKCYLRSQGEIGSGNEYAEWVHGQEETYEQEARRRMEESLPETERGVAPVANEHLKTAQWRMALNLTLQTPDRSADSHVRELELAGQETRGLSGPRSGWQLESRLHAVERVPAEGRGRPAQFVPIRFIFRNKLTADDRLLLAFDALVLSQVLGREVSLGKIIHGELCSCARESAANFQDHATDAQSGSEMAALSRAQLQVTKVKTLALAGEVRKRLGKMTALLANPAPPNLVLNRHCAECEFRDRCRKIAMEKDDLSLLANMSAKERQKLRGKGIFTVTQLSYTFRPRRRSKRQRDKREKYHHALKALPIREQKIHIVGSPELKIEGTPVYLDVEGLPDRDFYYLIGLRIGHGESAVQHSLWADTVADESKIWREFLAILETIEKPVLIHYGGYETEFLKQMSKRHEPPLEGSAAMKAIVSAVNLVSVMFSQLYFPTYSNGLKELGAWLKLTWPHHTASGLETIAHRKEWECHRNMELRRSLAGYNSCDCIALHILTMEIQRLCQERVSNPNPSTSSPIHTDDMQSDMPYRFGKVAYALPEFDAINKAAYWDYQQARIRLRTSKISKAHQKLAPRSNMQKRTFTKTREASLLSHCPHCNGTKIRHGGLERRVVDIQFTRTGLRRNLVRYLYHQYKCLACGGRFTDRPEQWPKHLVGDGLLVFVCYQLIQQRLSRRMISDGLFSLFGIKRAREWVEPMKERAAEVYGKTYDQLKATLIQGDVIHADETHVSLGGKRSFVWVFSSSRQVIFVHTETREGEFLGEFFKDFDGVLVSDFYAAYDSIPCAQQKCLVHLLRDINTDLLKRPFDEDLKWLAQQFADTLKPIIETIDRFGLKARFLRRHRQSVRSFYRNVGGHGLRSETAVKYLDRFLKNRGKLFVFLEHDGVSWNNNSAEHAVKAFVFLRKAIGGSSTKKGIAEYLVLLSIYETCKRNQIAFLDFLRSGEQDIHAFAESRRKRRRRTQTRPVS